MAIAPYIRRLRELVGSELLVLPSVAVLPRDVQGRVLLVRVTDTGHWAVIGGAIEPDESPHDAAVRESKEEANVTVNLASIITVLGGPQYRMTYPNGDQTSYVSVVFDATVVDGDPRPDGDETSAVAWFERDRLPYDEMSAFTRALLGAVGLGPPSAKPGSSTS
jgi:ADP-ribose pyrophosphatase YjhB (NUDIX family)